MSGVAEQARPVGAAPLVPFAPTATGHVASQTGHIDPQAMTPQKIHARTVLDEV